jgi:ERCC4-type nuclease
MNPGLLDIFSKKITIRDEAEKIKIVADHREKNSLIIAELESLGLEVEMKQLPVADFIVKNTAIERKTVSDFLNSMINKRLLRQLEELQQYPDRLIILEGLDNQELYPESRGINPNAIRGFILSILLKHKVPIVFSKNYEDTAKFINILARKQDAETGIRAVKRIMNKKEQLQFILEGFPGIGPKTAKKLLKKYKTLKNIFNVGVKDIEQEIGKKAGIFDLLEDTYQLFSQSTLDIRLIFLF